VLMNPVAPATVLPSARRTELAYTAAPVQTETTERRVRTICEPPRATANLPTFLSRLRTSRPTTTW
jgi:hypothetical protein